MQTKFLAVFVLTVFFAFMAISVEASEIKGVSMEQTSDYLFLAHKDEGKVYVFSNSNVGELVKTIYVGSSPSHLLLDGNNLLVALSGTKKIEVIDTKNLNILFTIDTPKMPYQMARGGDKLFVTVSRNNGSQYDPFVIVYPQNSSTTGDTIQPTWPQGYFVGGDELMVDPLNANIFFGNKGYSPDNISKYSYNEINDIKFLKQNDHGALGSNGQQFVLDDQKIYFAAGSGGTGGYKLQVVNTIDLTKIADLEMGPYPNSVEFDSSYIYGGKSAFYDEGDVKVFKRSNYEPVRSYDLADRETLVSEGISVGANLYAVTEEFLYNLDKNSEKVTKIYNFLTNAKPKSDLIITDAQYSISDDKSKIYFDLKVKNVGNIDVEDSFYLSYDCENQDDLKGGIIVATDLLTGKEEPVRISRNITKKEDIATTCKFYVDRYIPFGSEWDNQIDEEDENNNTLSRSLNIYTYQLLDEASTPDLVIKDIYEFNGKVRVEYKNMGKGAAEEGFDVYLTDTGSRLNQGGGTYDKKIVQKGARMQPGELRYEDFEFSGEKVNMMTAQVDSANTVAEIHETNNKFSKLVSTMANALPDLAIRGVHLPTKSDPRIVAEISNIGAVKTNFADGVKVSVSVKDSKGYLVALKDRSYTYLSNINPGTFSSAYFTIHDELSGEYEITIYVDNAENGDSGFIEEKDESNNKLVKTVNIENDSEGEMKLGDGTHNLKDGDRVKMDNGVIIKPVYFVSGSGSTEFRNVKLEVYSGATKLGETEALRVGWDTKEFSFQFSEMYKKYTFQVYVSSLGQNMGVWFSTLTFKSIEEEEVVEEEREETSEDDSDTEELRQRVKELERQVIELERKLTVLDNKFAEKYSGTMFLDVENHGRLWYVDPESKKRFYFQNGSSALLIGSRLATGITYEDIQKIPIGVPEKLFNLKDNDGDGLPNRLEAALGSDLNNADTDGDGISDKDEIDNGYSPLNNAKFVFNQSLVDRFEGKMLLQVSGPNSHGEIWYIKNGKRWYGGTEDSMYEIMKARSLGAIPGDIRKIEVGEMEY